MWTFLILNVIFKNFHSVPLQIVLIFLRTCSMHSFFFQNDGILIVPFVLLKVRWIVKTRSIVGRKCSRTEVTIHLCMVLSSLQINLFQLKRGKTPFWGWGQAHFSLPHLILPLPLNRREGGGSRTIVPPLDARANAS